MNTPFLRRLFFLAFMFLISPVLLSGCVVGGGYGYYGADYYEPAGVYGDWGPNYYVAPYRGREHYEGGHFERGHHEGEHRERFYRPAPVSRPIPTIPSNSRFNRSRPR